MKMIQTIEEFEKLYKPGILRHIECCGMVFDYYLLNDKSKLLVLRQKPESEKEYTTYDVTSNGKTISLTNKIMSPGHEALIDSIIAKDEKVKDTTDPNTAYKTTRPHHFFGISDIDVKKPLVPIFTPKLSGI